MFSKQSFVTLSLCLSAVGCAADSDEFEDLSVDVPADESIDATNSTSFKGCTVTPRKPQVQPKCGVLAVVDYSCSTAAYDRNIHAWLRRNSNNLEGTETSVCIGGGNSLSATTYSSCNSNSGATWVSGAQIFAFATSGSLCSNYLDLHSAGVYSDGALNW